MYFISKSDFINKYHKDSCFEFVDENKQIVHILDTLCVRNVYHLIYQYVTWYEYTGPLSVIIRSHNTDVEIKNTQQILKFLKKIQWKDAYTTIVLKKWKLIFQDNLIILVIDDEAMAEFLIEIL